MPAVQPVLRAEFVQAIDETATSESCIHHLPIEETPVAVIDFETTGLSAGLDRVVEVSVVRVDPGQEPRLVFDSIVNPERRVSATEIHGITDDDVKDAPLFADVADEISSATAGCVVAAYNVYFDIRFLEYEMSRAYRAARVPHFCVMYLRPMLGLGPRCSLHQACLNHGVAHEGNHASGSDALAAGQLYCRFLKEMLQRGIRTFDQLAQLKAYKFINSFSLPRLFFTPHGPDKTTKSKSRRGPVIAAELVTPAASNETQKRRALGLYWDSLTSALADLEITDQEVRWLQVERENLGLAEEEVRVLHARAFASAISDYVYVAWLDDVERNKLARLHYCLDRLGWAPGH